MSESKSSYVALALSACAVAVTVFNTLLVTVPTRADLSGLQQTSSESRLRIDELDVGMTALASVLKIDRIELANAIASARSATEESSAVAAMQAKNVPPVGISAQDKAATQSVVLSTPTPMQPDQQHNPFTEAESPAPLAIASAKAQLLSIDQVDSVLAKRISENWYKPVGAKPELNTVVQLTMSRDGKISSVKLTKASGNAAFDDSAVSAVKAVAVIEEVSHLSDADFKKAYASRSIQFTPQMGG